MFYLGVYAAVSTYQFFEDFQSHLVSYFHAQITGVGSFQCYSFYKIISHPFDERSYSHDYPLVYTMFVLKQPSRYAFY